MSDAPTPPRGRIREVKEKIDGSVETFDLECWLRTPALVVGRWIALAGNAYGAPPGTISWGCWWRSRPYGAYRIHAPDGALLGYRLDALARVRIGPGEVRYRDLLLDARIAPDGRVTLEDEDEVAEAASRGLLTPHEQRRLRWVRQLFLRRPAAIRRRVDAAVEASVGAGSR